MRQDFFEYVPQFKILIAGNHKPTLHGVDEAIRRRFHLIPFTVTIPLAERDLHLPEKLRPEWPGILQWAIDGCALWQQRTLDPPAAVKNASEEYFSEEDVLGSWLSERCGVDKIYTTLSSELYRDWKQWTENAGERPGSQKTFSQNLAARGLTVEHTRSGNVLSGIALKPQTD